MTIDYANFTRASNLIHIIQGVSLLLVGAAQAYAADNKESKFPLSAALLLALSGAAMFVVMLALPGGWSFSQLAEALDVRRGFYIFIAFSCVFSAAGLSLFTKELMGRAGTSWQAMGLLLLAFAGILYFLLAWRVNEEAWRQVLVFHAAVGATLLVAVAVKALDTFRPRRALHLAWAVLLLVTGLQLVTYSESDGAFAPTVVSLQSSPELPAAEVSPK